LGRSPLVVLTSGDSNGSLPACVTTTPPRVATRLTGAAMTHLVTTTSWSSDSVGFWRY
jgi:hypothetical protein